MASTGRLQEEIESWEGFPRTMRMEDKELWNAMVKQVTEQFGEAVESSGKDLATDPFFMAPLLLQQKTIKMPQAEIRALGGLQSSPDSVQESLLP